MQAVLLIVDSVGCDTESSTTCLAKVGKASLLDRLVSQLGSLDLKRVVVVTAQKLHYVDAFGVCSTPVIWIENAGRKVDDASSLALAKQYFMEDDTLLLEANLLLGEGVLFELMEDSRSDLALVGSHESWRNGILVDMGETESIRLVEGGDSGSLLEESRYQLINVYKLSKEYSRIVLVPALERLSDEGDERHYSKAMFGPLSLKSDAVKARIIDNMSWYRVGDIQDLDIAEALFLEDESERTNILQNRFGGYWRYPQLLDYYYLVNPYYPPQELIDEMLANFKSLLVQYPSGMRVNALLAANVFGVKQEYVVVGNGAAELIKALMERFEGMAGFVRPTFDEYPNRYSNHESCTFYPDNPDFSYSAQDVIDHFESKGIKILAIVNPDNPSGNYLPKRDMESLAKWCLSKEIKLILDESFADFSDECNNTFVDDELLEKYPNLFVIKSISKSFGVPGIRLGILASSDERMIAFLKKDVSIWNINSFGEFYMQIARKYQGYYAAALVRFRESRVKFAQELSGIEQLRVVPSQANYLLVELLNGLTSEELVEKMLCDHAVLVKDLSSKIKYEGRQYIRLAIRNDEDNARLCRALKRVFAAL